MNAERLYHLIHSLTPSQKANFSVYLGAGKGKSTKFKLLYDRILTERSYNEKKIRGKEFAVSARFYQNRELLLDKIIQSLVFFSEQKLSLRSYVFKAMELGAIDHARRRLSNEMETARREEDYDFLEYLNALRARIEQAYRIEFDLEGSDPGLQNSTDRLAQLRLLFRRVNQLLKQGRGEAGDLAAKSLQYELDSIPRQGDESQYLGYKILSGIEMLRKNHEAAYLCQLEAVAILERDSFPLTQQMLAREYYLLVNHAMRFNYFEIAEHAVLKFSLLNAKSGIIDPSRQEMWIKAAIRVAYSRSNPDLMRKVLPSLDDLVKTARPEIYLLNLFLAGMTFFQHNDFTTALSLVEKIRSQTKSPWPEIYWATETLRSLIHAELGNHELCETIFRSSIRLAKQTGARYPELVVRTANRMIDLGNKADKEILFGQYLTEMQSLKKDKKEEPALDLMDFTFWFRSNAGSISKWEAFLFRENSSNNQEPVHRNSKAQ